MHRKSKETRWNPPRPGISSTMKPSGYIPNQCPPPRSRSQRFLISTPTELAREREQAISLIRLYCNRPFRDHGKQRTAGRTRVGTCTTGGTSYSASIACITIYRSTSPAPQSPPSRSARSSPIETIGKNACIRPTGPDSNAGIDRRGHRAVRTPATKRSISRWRKLSG